VAFVSAEQITADAKRPAHCEHAGRRWYCWDWPRGGHSTWPLRQLRVPARRNAGRIATL